jgi:hypothetical protein
VIGIAEELEQADAVNLGGFGGQPYSQEARIADSLCALFRKKFDDSYSEFRTDAFLDGADFFFFGFPN